MWPIFLFYLKVLIQFWVENRETCRGTECRSQLEALMIVYIACRPHACMESRQVPPSTFCTKCNQYQTYKLWPLFNLILFVFYQFTFVFVSLPWLQLWAIVLQASLIRL